MNARPRHIKRRRCPGRLRRVALLRDVRGATAIEYGLILSLVVIAIVGAIVTLANGTTTMWNNVSDQVSRAH